MQDALNLIFSGLKTPLIDMVSCCSQFCRERCRVNQQGPLNWIFGTKAQLLSCQGIGKVGLLSRRIHCYQASRALTTFIMVFHLKKA